MAAKLFKLKDVPEDETEEIRRLLVEHEIEFYETYAGGWGISVPAIWIYDDERLEEARALVEQYQQERTARIRAAYDELKARGEHQTMFSRIRLYPVQFVVLTALALFMLYVSLSPFLNFGE